MLATMSQRAYKLQLSRCRLQKSLVVANIKNMSYHVEKLSLKSGLHTVGRIPENACDDASKRILKLSNID